MVRAMPLTRGRRVAPILVGAAGRGHDAAVDKSPSLGPWTGRRPPAPRSPAAHRGPASAPIASYHQRSRPARRLTGPMTVMRSANEAKYSSSPTSAMVAAASIAWAAPLRRAGIKNRTRRWSRDRAGRGGGGEPPRQDCVPLRCADCSAPGTDRAGGAARAACPAPFKAARWLRGGGRAAGLTLGGSSPIAPRAGRTPHPPPAPWTPPRSEPQRGGGRRKGLRGRWTWLPRERNTRRGGVADPPRSRRGIFPSRGPALPVGKQETGLVSAGTTAAFDAVEQYISVANQWQAAQRGVQSRPREARGSATRRFRETREDAGWSNFCAGFRCSCTRDGRPRPQAGR